MLTEEAAAATLELSDSPLVLVGHSHVALADHARTTVTPAAVRRPAGSQVALNGRRLLNPGSVGQPRDGDPRAAWLLLDLDERFAEFHRVPYSIETHAGRDARAGSAASARGSARAWRLIERAGSVLRAGQAGFPEACSGGRPERDVPSWPRPSRPRSASRAAGAARSTRAAPQPKLPQRASRRRWPSRSDEVAQALDAGDSVPGAEPRAAAAAGDGRRDQRAARVPARSRSSSRSTVGDLVSRITCVAGSAARQRQAQGRARRSKSKHGEGD